MVKNYFTTTMATVFKETPDTKKLWKLTLRYFNENESKFNHLIDSSVKEEIQQGVWQTAAEFLATMFVIQNEADSPPNVKKYIHRVIQLINGSTQIGKDRCCSNELCCYK